MAILQSLKQQNPQYVLLQLSGSAVCMFIYQHSVEVYGFRDFYYSLYNDDTSQTMFLLVTVSLPSIMTE